MPMKPNWFIALPISAGRWFSALVADTPRGIRRFHPEDLHVTVAFLGACGPDRAQEAWERIADRLHSPVTARFGALRPMGPAKKPSAYSLTFTEGQDALAAIVAWRDDALAAAGARPARRPPLPHVTVARPPRRAGQAVREAGSAWMAKAQPDRAWVQIDRIALYTWSQDRKQRLFQTTAQRPLAGY